MIYGIGVFLTRLYLTLFNRVVVAGLENVPKQGPFLVYANHPSMMDMFLIAYRVKHKVHYMTKAELFKNPLLGWILRAVGSFPVHRGKGDISSVKNALRLLKAGKVVGIFPEGTRTQERDLNKKKGGAALIAMTSGVPVLPIRIADRYHAFKKIRLVIGEPFSFPLEEGHHPSREELIAGNTKIMDRIYGLSQP